MEKPMAKVERRENSVAVLPFDNLAPNPETGYFSDGVADEATDAEDDFAEVVQRFINAGHEEPAEAQ
jgi:TolB-like protein